MAIGKRTEQAVEQLSRYLAGPARSRLTWRRREGVNQQPFWVAHDRSGRSWTVHPPDPADRAGFTRNLHHAVTTIAAAERRPREDVISDIAAVTTTSRDTVADTAPARGTARLLDHWRTRAPRPRPPRIVTLPADPGELDDAIADVFTRGYHHAWHHRLHHILVAVGAAALDRLTAEGAPPMVPVPATVAEIRRLHNQITVASVEQYLSAVGWRLLDVTPTVRRWHTKRGDKTEVVEVPATGHQWRSRINTAARTIAALEGRTYQQVLADFVEPALGDPHLATVHTLLIDPPKPADEQVTAHLDTLRLPTNSGHLSLRDLAHQQIASCGASDAVWHAATRAGHSDATAHAVEILGPDAAAVPAPKAPARFWRGPNEATLEIAARIWTAGAHLPPAAHARWFTRTWWPYHVTRTIRSAATTLATHIEQSITLPAALSPGRPSPELLRSAARAARPERSSEDRFIAVYRLVEPAAHRAAVAAATTFIQHQAGDHGGVQADLHAAARAMRDLRRVGGTPTTAVLRAALGRAMPAAEPAAAAQPAQRRRAAFPPPWRAVAAAGDRTSTRDADLTVIDPQRHRRHQLVTTAINTLRGGLR